MTHDRRSKRRSSGRPPVTGPTTERYDTLLFVHQGPSSCSSGQSSPYGNVASHARRWQTDKKHRVQRDAAQQGASYARSLVGWRSNVPLTSGMVTRTVAETESELEGAERQQKTKGSWHDESQALQLSLSVAGGLRNDPFNAFPSPDHSKEVMQMVDYYIHVWSPYKSTAFDTAMGFNANLNLCWPLALQDNMLFDATLAVARVAYCLGVQIPPADDEFMLYHRGTALARLRTRVAARVSTDEEVIFTIARMLSISYMCSDFQAWDLHFAAYKEAAERYLDSRPDATISQVIHHRLRSWSALKDFRAGLNPLRDPTGTPSRILSYPEILDEDDQAQVYAQLPPDLRELATTGCISNEVVEIIFSINEAVENASTNQDGLEMWVAAGNPTRLCGQLLTMVMENDMLDKEFILCCGLIALCLQLHHLFYAQSPTQSTTRPGAVSKPTSSVPLRKLAEAFINKKLALEIDCQRHVFVWASVVLGSLMLLHYDDLRVKGQIMLVNLATKLQPFPPPFEDGHHADWATLERSLRGFIYHDPLASQWEECWEQSMKTQEEWELNGLLKIKPPQKPDGEGVDIVEYMVLRDARASLPIMRRVLVH